MRKGLVKPRVLLDQDGPLGGFDLKFWERCAENGWPADCEPHEQTHRYQTEHIIDRKHRKAAREMLEQPGWFADLPVIDGARDGIERLAEVADVWIVTKPMESNPTCRDDKGRWIRKHFGEKWEHRLIITPDKSIVGGDILLDDAPKLSWFERATWAPVIFETSWNGEGSDWEGLPRWSWDQPVEDLFDAMWLGCAIEDTELTS